MLRWTLGGPSPEIVGQTAREGAPNFDYTIYVECTVRNNGRSGQLEVIAELTGGGFWKKRETVSVDKGRERKLVFEFPEADLSGGGLSGFNYQCSAE